MVVVLMVVVVLSVFCCTMRVIVTITTRLLYFRVSMRVNAQDGGQKVQQGITGH